MVTGASGGLGVHALQIAKALGGKTIAVTSSEGKLGSLIELGVDDVVPVGELDFVEIVRAVTAEEGVDVVVDTVGSPLFSSSVRALAQYGRIVLLGEVAGGRTEVSLPELLFRDARVMGSTGAQRRHTGEGRTASRGGGHHARHSRNAPAQGCPHGSRLDGGEAAVRSGGAAACVRPKVTLDCGTAVFVSHPPSLRTAFVLQAYPTAPYKRMLLCGYACSLCSGDGTAGHSFGFFATLRMTQERALNDSTTPDGYCVTHCSG